MSDFTIEVSQNQYLPAGATVVDAIVTVTSTGVAAGPAPTAAEVIMVDCSGSMASPATKLAEAKKACFVAIDTLRDGVAFAIIAGRADAQMCFPTTPQLVVADSGTREAAKAAVSRLLATGGTAIGQWLHLANQLYDTHPAEVRHAIMLTDGRNQHETPQQLEQVLRNCEGRFVCDSRGVGNDWVGSELRTVASRLLGTADGLEDPRDLPAAFQAMTSAAMGKAHAEVALRLWTPGSSVVRFVKLAYPQVEDLTARKVQVSPRLADYPTGAWGSESRDYHISVEVPPGAIGDEASLAARVMLMAGDQELGMGRVFASWTDDTALSTQINKRVAHYTGQAELASAIQEGLAAQAAGDVEVATAKLGKAVKLAAESGHTDTAKLLRRVVDVVDEGSGTVRLKRNVDNVANELADVRSVKTVRVKKNEES
jgi:hypothetical protein